MTPTKILYIASSLPPENNGGTRRCHSFVQTAEKYGFEIHAVALLSDTAEDPPGSEAERTEYIKSPLDLLRQRFASRNRTSEQDRGGKGRPGTKKAGWLSRILRGMYRYVLIPDKLVLSLPVLVYRSVRTSMRVDPVAILVSCPAWSSAVGGWLVSLLTGKKLIIEMRDLWMDDPCVGKFYEDNRIRRIFETRLESLVLARASKIILTAGPARKLLEEVRPKLAPKTAVFNNFYVAREFSRPDDKAEDVAAGEVLITHAGKLGRSYSGRTPRPFIEALESLAKSGSIPSSLRVLFVGALTDDEEKMLAESSVGSSISTKEQVPRTEAIRIMRDSSGLLLIDDDREYGTNIVGKVYDYLAAGIPMLALVPPGATRDFIEQNVENPYIADVRDMSQIRAVLRRFMRDLEENTSEYSVKPKFFDRYSDESIMSTYFALLSQEVHIQVKSAQQGRRAQ